MRAFLKDSIISIITTCNIKHNRETRRMFFKEKPVSLCSSHLFVYSIFLFFLFGSGGGRRHAWVRSSWIIATIPNLHTWCVVYMCVVFSSHPFWTSSSLDVPAGVTQEEGHTGFLIHLPSAVRALIFVARRIQPFLSLVDREVEFCVLTN